MTQICAGEPIGRLLERIESVRGRQVHRGDARAVGEVFDLARMDLARGEAEALPVEVRGSGLSHADPPLLGGAACRASGRSRAGPERGAWLRDVGVVVGVRVDVVRDGAPVAGLDELDTAMPTPSAARNARYRSMIAESTSSRRRNRGRARPRPPPERRRLRRGRARSCRHWCRPARRTRSRRRRTRTRVKGRLGDEQLLQQRDAIGGGLEVGTLTTQAANSTVSQRRTRGPCRLGCAC